MDAELKGFSDKMDHGVEHFRKEIQSLRTGRPSLSLIEHVRVDYYGNLVSLDKVAALNIVDNRMITITPWETKIMPEIEKAIMAANLGLTPQNDGKAVRIVVPPMTEERRKQMVKLLKKMTEDAKVVLRNIRRDANEDLKKRTRTDSFRKTGSSACRTRCRNLSKRPEQSSTSIPGKRNKKS